MTKESGGFDQIDQWKSTMFLYSSALKSINTKIEILNNEFIQLYNYNPIEHITSRLKTPESIVKKLKNDGCEVTIENMVEHLNDIAGIRIICSFMSDIYPIADMIARQADITVLHVKDYIKYPKTNGYKSYHMVVTIPVYLSEGKRDTKVEIQIRTIAMDFWASLEHKIAYKFEGKAPDYLVVSHLEPDHAGNIRKFLVKYPETVVVANAKTVAMLPQFFELDTEELSILEVKEGDTLKLGRHTLHFVMAPMVHWPEVMVEYDEADKILFSADGFGRFGALSQGCTYDAAGKAQDVLEQEWTGEARRYFINIVGKYGANVQGLLKKAAVLDIEKIAPLHGPVLTGGLEYFLDKYAKWSSYQPEEKGVVVAYSSIHGNTKHAAEHFASILKEQGEENVAVFDLARADMAQAVADSFRYDALVLAGITYDGGLMPCMEDFLYHLKMKNFQNRYAAVIENGSWGPVSGRLMKSYLENMKNITICEDMVTIRSVMKKADGQALEKLAEKVIKRS